MDESAELEVALDGRAHRVPRGTTLAALVGQLGHQPEQVTTAVNGTFVRREARAGCVLQAGDAVLLFQPIVGG
ncbi:sulfur carrier protein ThiS [Ramlibacter sp.]|uniref:sulfur carrier protein ThiS n=1 Tax=Ramlibacter sp. TaxID=1917967 RepID=UPI002B931182|nr:sulfur carrier protein ThiS [Ramlibacter sp.]HWI80837.1 sulfur carrier protein ThiS [Ramlibacter sp.]